jgi:hypothetical protein
MGSLYTHACLETVSYILHLRLHKVFAFFDESGNFVWGVNIRQHGTVFGTTCSSGFLYRFLNNAHLIDIYARQRKYNLPVLLSSYTLTSGCTIYSCNLGNTPFNLQSALLPQPEPAIPKTKSNIASYFTFFQSLL